MADQSKAPKGLLITGIVLLILGLGGCGYGCTSLVGAFSGIADDADATALNSEMTLRATGSTAIVFSTNSAAECYGEAADGSPIEFESPDGNATGSFSDGGSTYELLYQFDTSNGDDYRVICGDEAGTAGEYYVVSFDLGKIGTSIGGIGIGAVLFVLGVIFLIIGLVKRSKWKKNNKAGVGGPGFAGAPGAVPPPPGGGYVPPAAAPTPPPPAGSPTPPPPMPSTPPPSPGTPPPPSAPPSPGTPPPPSPGTPPPPGQPG